FAGSSGELMCCTAATFASRATTSLTAESKAGAPARAERLWISTLSLAGNLNPASRILPIRPDSPGPALVGSACFVPTWLPTANASTTSASQPKVAVFQCAALQRPTRAATLEFCLARDMVLLLWVDNTSDATTASLRGRRSKVGTELVPADDSASY